MNGIAESAFKVQRFKWQPKPSKGKSSGGGGTWWSMKRGLPESFNKSLSLPLPSQQSTDIIFVLVNLNANISDTLAAQPKCV